MKTKIALSLFTLVTALSSHAGLFSTTELSRLASDRVGNGGFAHVCRDQSGKITSARLLDLWEADGIGAHQSNAPVEEQIAAAFAKLKAFSPNAHQVIGYRYQVIKNAVVKTPRALSITEDAFPPYEPANGCKYEQVARFEPVLTELGTSGLRINSEIYDSAFFSNSDRAALMVHEAIYLVDRLRNGSTDSQRARTLTAHLMSGSLVPDAVRMLFMYLIGTQHTNDRTLNPLFALSEPKQIAVQFKIWSIEDLTADGMTPDEKLRQYRCTVGSQLAALTDVQGDSGYRSVYDLTNYNPEYLLHATIGAPEHLGAGRFKTVPQDDYTVMNFVTAQCYKKTSNGKEVRVPFTGTISFAGAKCLMVSAAGSTFVESGERCDMQIQATASSISGHPELDAAISFGVVRKQ